MIVGSGQWVYVKFYITFEKYLRFIRIIKVKIKVIMDFFMIIRLSTKLIKKYCP